MKRILLFVLTNVAVLLVLMVVTHLLGVDRLLNARGGLDLQSLLIFSAIVGFTGSLISLAISKPMAKWSTGARVITQPRDATESWLLNSVRNHATRTGIGMPEVAVYDSPEINAFATGARRDAALVAVSSGLLRSLRQNEIDAVLGHEISHVANGDMVTLTLLQGVLNTFVVFLSRVVGYFVDRMVLRSDNDRGMGMGFFLATMVTQVLLGFLASMIVMWYSRQREFRADAGGASLSGRDNMVAALERLKSVHEGAGLPNSLQAFGIAGGRGGLTRLFMSHPPLEERIAALRAASPAS